MLACYRPLFCKVNFSYLVILCRLVTKIPSPKLYVTLLVKQALYSNRITEIRFTAWLKLKCNVAALAETTFTLNAYLGSVVNDLTIYIAESVTRQLYRLTRALSPNWHECSHKANCVTDWSFKICLQMWCNKLHRQATNCTSHFPVQSS